ncbi:MAG TPA: type II toxin-antitoxin system VapC family toxin [Gammaproteobacteria bacterium]|nr:type II toxin-antitoxin system VapC family toxin [Gammaproteobacteria bacterium]
MSYLLDTNVISELFKSQPNKHVVSWIDQIAEPDIFLSVLTIGELRKGIEKIQPGSKKSKLIVWLEQELLPRFAHRLLDINIPVVERWGRLLAASKQSLPAIDSLLAATALHYDLCLVTRNTADFIIPTLTVFNPWEWTL